MTNATPPRRTRPDIPAEYQTAQHDEGMVEWAWVAGQLQAASNYWLVTVYPDGRPHVAALWGAWVGNRLYFSGSSTTRYARNLAANPTALAHLESGNEVVIVYGSAVPIASTPTEDAPHVAAEYLRKYNAREDATFALVPTKVLAWTMKDYAASPTKFVFD